MTFRRNISLLLACAAAAAARGQANAPAGSDPKATQLDPVVVSGDLDETRGLIQPSLGAT